MKVHACILALCLYASAAGAADCTVLRMDGPGEVPLYTTERAMLACYVSLLSADGAESMAQALVGSCADAFRTGVPAGTHARILERGGLADYVLVLDGPTQGVRGYVFILTEHSTRACR